MRGVGSTRYPPALWHGPTYIACLLQACWSAAFPPACLLRTTTLQAIAVARRAGCVVAMTAGDAGVVERHYAELWQAIDLGIDLLFTNASEAAALLRYEPPSAAQRQGLAAAASHLHCATGEQLALRLAPHCSVVVVTDGAAGSYIAALGEIHCQPPVWMESPPVDTCGAGECTPAVAGRPGATSPSAVGVARRRCWGCELFAACS